MGNKISLLSNLEMATKSITGSYQSNKLYTGVINGNSYLTFNLRLWVDHATTIEQANKTYSSKISVGANPDIVVDTTPDVTFTNSGATVTGTTTATNVKYCVSDDNICIPSTSVSVSNNRFNITLPEKETNQIVCATLNNTKTICSDGIKTKIYASDIILANKTIEERTDFSTTLTENTTGKIYKTQDDDGDTYYFAGAVDNNWVQFGEENGSPIYWRIIRINGDGTIRLIYNGTSMVQTGTSTQIGTYKFSHKDATGSPNYTYINDNAYVGYMYGTVGSSTYNATHTNTNSSYAKQKVDEWYNTNLNKTGIKEKISTNTGFCGDRSIDPTYGTGLGYGTNQTGYMERNRLDIEAPSLKCTNTNDLYTVSESTKGNRALTYPVGLITADEVAYAGGKLGSVNSSYYLNTNQYYWTMTPCDFNGSYANVFDVGGMMSIGDVFYADGVRPVINLMADTHFSAEGDGTTAHPYVVV